MHDNSDQPAFLDEVDARQLRMWQRKARKARFQQAGILFWIFASTFVIVPLIFHHSPLWFIAIVTGIIGGIIGWFLPTNVPMPRPPPRESDQPYGVYDPRGPYGPRS